MEQTKRSPGTKGAGALKNRCAIDQSEARLRRHEDLVQPAVLAARLEVVTEQVRREFGDAAFAVSREAVAVHESSHAVAAAHEQIRTAWAKVFKAPVAAPAAGALTPGLRLGAVQTRGTKWKADARVDPRADLSEARFVLAGRIGELMSPHGRAGCALDELVLSQAIAAVAARKMSVDPDLLWKLQVRRRTKLILRANQGVVDAIAAKLIRDGFIYRRRLREFLEGVRRVP